MAGDETISVIVPGRSQTTDSGGMEINDVKSSPGAKEFCGVPESCYQQWRRILIGLFFSQ